MTLEGLPEAPDFEKMLQTAQIIGELSEQASDKDIEIKKLESAIVRKVMNDPLYFKNGKAPAMNVVEITYKYTGFDGELIPLRKDLGKLEAMLEKYRLVFKTLEAQIKVYQTQSSNIRGALG